MSIAMSRMMISAATLLASAAAFAQAAKAPAQVVKPPVSQAWIDVATYSGFGMPMGGGGAGGMSMMGSMFGGQGGSQGGKNTFGMTQTGSAGRWVDVTLYTSRNPSLAEATQAVPAGTQLAPTLKLVAPKVEKGPPPTPGDDTVVEPRVRAAEGQDVSLLGLRRHGARRSAARARHGDRQARGVREVLHFASCDPARGAQRGRAPAVAERSRFAHGAGQRVAGRRARVYRDRACRRDSSLRSVRSRT